MESLSRPFHSRKLSNATTFSTKNAYDGVFSGHRRKYTGASVISVEDYREIFGSSQAASSIPVLDFSNLVEQSGDLSSNFRSSNPDYSKIFGGFRDEQVAVSYDELFARDKARSPSSKTPTSQDPDKFSHKSPDALKQFNMSYNKITPKSKDELDNNTKYVTQVHATPGFTQFIDEQVHVNPPKMESKNQKSSPVHVSKSVSEEKKFKTFNIDFKTHPSKAVNHKTDTCEDGFDVNSDASASAAALLKAIEKAQESIRIAKESVGRKKKGLGRFSNKTFKDSLKVKNKLEDVTAATPSSQVFHDNSEKLFVAKKVIDEINGKFSECCKEFEDDNIAVSNSTQATCETESRPLDSTEKDEYASCSSEAVDEENNRIDETNNVFVDDYEEKIETTIVKEVESIGRVCEKIEADVSQELKDDKDDVRLSNSDELFEELNNLIVSENEKILNEKEDEFLEQEDIENAEMHEKRSDDEESEMIYNVCELEMDEDEQTYDNILQESEMNLQEIIQENDYTSEIKEEILDDNVTKEGEMIYDVCELEMNEDEHTCDNIVQESEMNLQDDCGIKQENDYTSQIKEETLDFDDNVSEECEVDLQNDCEIKEGNLDQEFEYIIIEEIDSTDDNNLEEVVDDVEFSEKISIDQTASDDNEDDYQVKSEINDINSEENDIKSEENAINSEENDIKSEENAINSEEYDVTSEENEINSEENDIKSESSSGTTHDVKMVFEESNKEKNILEETNIQLRQTEIPETTTTAEINKKHQEHEIFESGPSKVSGKQIDEMTAKNNRLAVDRAIREARERAFAEARERAERERAAVDKATQEVRQRMMAEAREKVAKASSVGNNKSSSPQSKLKAERAAVERATSEARQRALQKAISQKTVSDLNSSESALRTKAKLEKHNRIMERAAKALAEKERRDLLAQKEQAERNRLSENLDADIKRWSNGKEGNLRALLATLQYILGPESGWQAVKLTEIMSSSAVKKAYRKATLCVHPDKLQQRGASVQQKYICEKVFDLLKAAWNRFNSEER